MYEEITPGDILSGITLALRGAFPDSNIYTEDVEQGLLGGDFLITFLTHSSQPMNRTIVRSDTAFSLIYFPAVGNEECLAVSNKLLNALEVVTLPNGAKLRGFDGTGNLSDGILQFTIRYPHRSRLLASEDTMNTMEVSAL